MSSRQALAKRSLEACRNQLFFENRFLEQALFRLKWADNGAVLFGSDGSKFCYQIDNVLKRYMESPQQLMLDYLHMVLHCLYQHPFFASQEQRKYWDLATDIAVECVMKEIVADELCIDTKTKEQQCSVIDRIKNEIGVLSAQKIFVFLLRKIGTESAFRDFFRLDFKAVCKLFKRDDHDLWYVQKAVEYSNNPIQNREETVQQEFVQAGTTGVARQEIPVGQMSKQVQMKHSKLDLIAPKRQAFLQDQKQLQQIWKGVAEQVLLSVQSFSQRKRGDMAGNMVATLQNITRENYDYAAFLQKFALRLEERMQTNLDEFDYIYYMYGLQLDRRMPLVEPLEYKEKYLLREFVIAIDTSGSCAGDLVEKFLVKTYNILRQTESFSTKVNIHIIQCDAVVQNDTTIRSQKDLENYIAHLILKGFGGTDFRPVFAHVENMIQIGAIQRLEGLLYFTDGYGIFPAKPTTYKTAFVFLNQEEDVKVPAWAMKVYIEEEALT